MVRNSPLPSLPARLSRAAESARTVVQAAAFWVGALIPLTYVPGLLLVEFGRVDGYGFLVPLAVANVVACLLGHGYDPGS